MRYGAMNFPIRPIIEEIESIGRLGFDYLELAMDAPEAHYTIIRENILEIRKALNIQNLKLVCHLPTFVHTADLTESIRMASVMEMVNSLEVAAELTPLKAVVHPSYIGGLGVLVPDVAMGYALDAMGIFVEKAKQLGLRLCLENMFSSKYQNFVEPEDLAPVLEQFPDLELTLDTGHAHINQSNRDRILAFIEQYPNRIGHLHISDNAGDQDAHLPVGQGTIRFKKVMAALKLIGYDDTLTLEIFTDNRNDLLQSRERIARLLGVR